MNRPSIKTANVSEGGSIGTRYEELSPTVSKKFVEYVKTLNTSKTTLRTEPISLTI